MYEITTKITKEKSIIDSPHSIPECSRTCAQWSSPPAPSLRAFSACPPYPWPDSSFAEEVPASQVTKLAWPINTYIHSNHRIRIQKLLIIQHEYEKRTTSLEAASMDASSIFSVTSATSFSPILEISIELEDIVAIH